MRAFLGVGPVLICVLTTAMTVTSVVGMHPTVLLSTHTQSPITMVEMATPTAGLIATPRPSVTPIRDHRTQTIVASPGPDTRAEDAAAVPATAIATPGRGSDAPVSTPHPPAPLPLSHRFKPREDDIVRRVRPGVIHIRRVTDDPIRINVLLFDLTAPQFDVRSALGDGWFSGRTRTSYMVKEYHALAGVNGDLFAEFGTPQGLTMIDSRVAMAPMRRATFAWSRDRKPFIGYFVNGWTWDAQVITPNRQRMRLGFFNQPCRDGQICLYNDFVRVVPAVWNDVKVVIGPSGRVFEVVQGKQVVISAGMRVLQGLGSGASWLLANAVPDSTLTIDIKTDRPLDSYTQAISGGPIILRDGNFVQDCMCFLTDCSAVSFEEDETRQGLICESFDTAWKESHYNFSYLPRTGIGYDKWQQTLIAAVVDGYQPGFSRGMLQREFADLLREFGADTAMELDGGGSATMVLGGEVMNRPSDDTGERYVANALLFFWNEGMPDLKYPTMPRPSTWRRAE